MSSTYRQVFGVWCLVDVVFGPLGSVSGVRSGLILGLILAQLGDWIDTLFGLLWPSTTHAIGYHAEVSSFLYVPSLCQTLFLSLTLSICPSRSHGIHGGS